MTARELFLRVLSFESAPRTINWEFGYWGGAILRWYEEGLERVHGLPEGTALGDVIAGPGLQWPESSYDPSLYLDRDVARAFQFDQGFTYLHVNQWFCPRFEEVILEETEETITSIGTDGITRKTFKDKRCMPAFLDWPVKQERDWDRLVEERLNLKNLEERFLPGFQEDVERAKKRDYPLSLLGDPCGFFGSIRYLVGDVNQFYLYYDNPKLIERMAQYLCDFWIQFMEELFSYTNFDFGYLFEDMAGKQGPLIGPAIFQEFMAPYYRRLIECMRSHGVKHVIVDSDGYIESLIPLLRQVGVTGMLPFEIQAGNDLLRIRRQHPDFQILGGFNKAVLRDGNEHLEQELETELECIQKLVRQGGYIPFGDHFIPPDVSFANFSKYRRRLNEIVFSTKVL